VTKHGGSYVDAGAALLRSTSYARTRSTEMPPCFRVNVRWNRTRDGSVPSREVNGRWKFRRIDWPFALFDVFARRTPVHDPTRM